MKKFILLFAFFMLFKPALPFLEYAVLYDYIKNELCENLDKPALKCNGKCHLKKELSKASDSENGKEKNSSSSTDYQVLFFQDYINNVSFIPLQQTLKEYFTYNRKYLFRYMDAVFHPPLL